MTGEVATSAAFWIERLGLRPHPEGGFFRETYRAAETIPAAALPPRYGGARAFATAIYYLLPSGEISALHRLRSDELWHFHAGSRLVIVTLDEDGGLSEMALGADVERGEMLQVTVPSGVWFGAYVPAPQTFVLAGCTVAPGFEFADLELADRAALLRTFPQHHVTIERLTHAPRDTR